MKKKIFLIGELIVATIHSYIVLGIAANTIMSHLGQHSACTGIGEVLYVESPITKPELMLILGLVISFLVMPVIIWQIGKRVCEFDVKKERASVVLLYFAGVPLCILICLVLGALLDLLT